MSLPDAAARQEGQMSLAFLIFLAMMTSVVALTVDAVLPAIDTISSELAFEDPNDRHRIVTYVLFGLGASQLVFGALADSIGRKPTAMIGWGIYITGTLLAAFSETATTLLIGRFLQGFGAGGPRVIGNTLARDLYQGPALARALSLVMTMFMLVPAVAPLVGQAIEAMLGWRAIFVVYLLLAATSGLWYLLGIEETLDPARRRPLRLRPLALAFREVLTTRQTMACTFAAAFTFGPFIAYLATAQQVFEEVYDLGRYFPLAFASVAIAFACATFLNTRVIMSFGMRTCCIWAFSIKLGLAGCVTLAIWSGFLSGVPPLAIYLGLIGVIFMATAILVTNLTAAALDPMGHMAGTAAAVINSVSALLATFLGGQIAGYFQGDVTPLFVGFVLFGSIGLVLFLIGMRR